MPEVVRIRLRGDTAANWTSVNPVLAARVMAVETDTRKFKFGDGVTAWNALAYASAGSGTTHVYGEVPTGAVNGSNTDFTLAHAPLAGTLRLYSGIRLKGGGVDYTQAGVNISMTTAPDPGQNLLADYEY